MRRRQTRKIGLQGIELLSLSNPLKMVKKTCQALESLNFDLRDRSQAQITMLGQDQHETDTKNWNLTNSASELTNPLEMVKKTIQAFEQLNSNVRARSQAQITFLGQDKQETDAKNWTSTNLAPELTNPLEMVKKHFRLLNHLILMSELVVIPKLRIWAQMSSKQTQKSDCKEFSF